MVKLYSCRYCPPIYGVRHLSNLKRNLKTNRFVSFKKPSVEHVNDKELPSKVFNVTCTSPSIVSLHIKLRLI